MAGSKNKENVNGLRRRFEIEFVAEFVWSQTTAAYDVFEFLYFGFWSIWVLMDNQNSFTMSLDYSSLACWWPVLYRLLVCLVDLLSVQGRWVRPLQRPQWVRWRYQTASIPATSLGKHVGLCSRAHRWGDDIYTITNAKYWPCMCVCACAGCIFCNSISAIW